MSELLQEIMEDEAQRLYCCYCAQPKTSYSCCQENHFRSEEHTSELQSH